MTEPRLPEVEIDNPGPGVGFVIESVHAFVAVHKDGDEGICAMRSGDTWMPLISGDPQRLEELRPYAERLARDSGIPIRLVRFDHREEIEVLE